MRLQLALTLCLVVCTTHETEARADDDVLAPARPGIERFQDHHHELGVVYGVGGPVTSEGRYAVSGLRYHEDNGELLDAFFSSIFKIIDSKWNRRVDCSAGACIFLDATAYVPHMLGDRSEPGAKGGIVEFGLTVPKKHFVFQLGASIGFVSVRTPGEFVGDARDALTFAAHAPLAKWLTLSLRADLNLFALYPKKYLKGWQRSSPVAIGLHADLGRRIFATADFIRGDIVSGGEGWQLGLGARF